MKEIPNISGAELEIMQVLWEANKPLKIQEVSEGLKSSKWKYNTVGTLLMRMTEKGAVTSEKKDRVNYFVAAINKEEYKKSQTKNLISKLYNGSVKDLAVSLFKSQDMSDSDIDEIRKMFDL